MGLARPVPAAPAMPSLSHSQIAELFRSCPELAPRLVRESLGVDLPDYTSVEIVDATLAALIPTEHHLDLVLLLRDAQPVYALGVEVQLRRDADKPWVVPYYAMSLRLRHRCPVAVLMVCPKRPVAVWARRPIATGAPNNAFRMLVLGPDCIPRIESPEQANAMPELAVLSALTYRNSVNGLAVLLAALDAVDALDDERVRTYHVLLLDGLSAAARHALEAVMIPHDYKIKSPLLKKLIKIGRVEGRVEGRVASLLTVLSARGLTITDAERERILAATDDALVDQWLARAATATTTATVLDLD